MVSARTQRDPGRQSLGVVDLGEWVALWGSKTSGECMRRETGVADLRSYSEVGPKPEEGHIVW
jgi:hypothetical protein